MLNYWLKMTGMSTVIFAIFILTLRTQPYQDRIRPALAQTTCAAPCFMNIRPGTTSLPAAVAILAAHEWVDKGPDDFPSLVRDSIRFGAGIPRTLIDWRWTAAQPDWIDDEQPGILTVEDQTVLNIRVPTRFSLGEVLLAFGQPDEEQATAVQYSAWYAEENLFIYVDDLCAGWHDYERFVEIRFLAVAPRFDAPRLLICY